MRFRKRAMAGAAVLSMAAAGLGLNPAGASGYDHDDDDDEVTFLVTIENRSGRFNRSSAGVFNTPVGQPDPGPVFDGDAYEFTVFGNPGDKLSFASMFVFSNDWFFATGDRGLDLYDPNGTPVSGDITGQLHLLDAGTEADEAFMTGPNQPINQAGPNTGPEDPNNKVRIVDSVGPVSDFLDATVTPQGGGEFTVRVANVSGSSAYSTPVAPGAFTVHKGGRPVYKLNKKDKGRGLESLAEDGDSGPLYEWLNRRAVVASPLAPGAYVAGPDGQIFTVGLPDAGNGLESLAEDGSPGALAGTLVGTDVGTFGMAPAFPGDSYQFQVTAKRGDRLDFATMLVQSNDWFFAPEDGDGLRLFRRNGEPRQGNVTRQIGIFDAGTEVDEALGFGPNQAPRQSGPNTGADEGGVVHVEGLNVAKYIKVTLDLIDD
ncbi:MAG: hypothetical protein GY929_14650 [Actinomycetia bacterium]|nr:hypothetical protein [Actinomycetes bacterium]